jgi:hypothetical protein
MVASLQRLGLGLMVWLGWLVPFHRLPLPPHYAESALAAAIGLSVIGASASVLRSARWTLIATTIAAAMLVCIAVGPSPRFLPGMGLLMAIAAMIALIANALATSPLPVSRMAAVARDLAAGCVFAVAMLAIFLPLSRLRMPILTALAMLAIAVVVRGFARRARR